MSQPKLLDVVALLKPLAVESLVFSDETALGELAHLPVGLMGTVVEVHQRGEDSVYLVEFADTNGCEYAMALLAATDLLVLHPGLQVA